MGWLLDVAVLAWLFHLICPRVLPAICRQRTIARVGRWLFAFLVRLLDIVTEIASIFATPLWIVVKVFAWCAKELIILAFLAALGYFFPAFWIGFVFYFLFSALRGCDCMR